MCTAKRERVLEGNNCENAEHCFRSSGRSTRANSLALRVTRTDENDLRDVECDRMAGRGEAQPSKRSSAAACGVLERLDDLVERIVDLEPVAGGEQDLCHSRPRLLASSLKVRASSGGDICRWTSAASWSRRTDSR